MNRFFSTLIASVLASVVLAACGAGAPAGTTAPATPTGIWEGAQEFGDNDWSVSLDFDACTEDAPCAKVYYVLCAGEFAFQSADSDNLLFQENITEHPDQCFSGSTVQVDYRGQDKPMLVSWLGEDGKVVTTAEMRYQDPNAKPVIAGLGSQVDLFHFDPGGYTNFNSFVAVDGTLWIPDSGHGKLIRYDTSARQVAAEIQVGDPSKATFGDPQVVAVAGDSIWVTQCAERKLSRVDPATNRIVDSIQLDVEPYDIAIDGNTLWVTSFEPDQVLRVDAQTKEVIAIKDIGKPLGIALGGGAVWVAEHRQGNLVRIDPATNTIVERIQLPDGSTPENVIFADGSVWVANNLGRSISRVDPQTNLQTVIALPQRSVHVSSGGGFIWVGLYPDQDAEIDLSTYKLGKVDTSNNQVLQVFDFPGAGGSAYWDGTLWIDNRNDMSGDKLHGILLAR
jgi:streptogramin lyase